MNKLSIFLSFCLMFLLFSSCAPDLTDDVEWAYDVANSYSAQEPTSDPTTDPTEPTSDPTEPTSDPTDPTDPTEPTEPTEPTDTQSCTTIDGNMWSSLSSDEMVWNDAVSYCNNLTECGYSDWRLPNINKLRTLIKNCPGSQTGGSCAVKDPGCLSDSCWSSDCFCEYRENDDGYYSKLGDDVWLWSSSTRSDHTDVAWGVNFGNGYVDSYGKSSNNYVRCVR